MAFAAAPAVALDISLGAGADGSAGGNAGNSGGSASFGLSASASASAEHGSGNGLDALATGSTASASAASTADISSSIAADDPLRNVVALIEASSWNSTSFETVTGINGSTYDLAAWVTSDNSAALETALAAKANEIANLQAAIKANATFSTWVDAQNAEVSSVVAVGFAADGSLAVFTYD
jgi:hypothetical protein